MPEYYTSGISRKRKKIRKRTKPLWLSALDWCGYIATALLVVLSVLTLLCQYISPAKMGFVSTVVLAAPILYLLDIVVALYWVVRMMWKPLIVMSLLVVVGAFYAPRYFVADVWRDHKSRYSESQDTKILSYNLRGGVAEGLVEQVRSYRPNIFCLQEIPTGHSAWRELREKYNTTYREGAEGSCHIFTPHRILKSGKVGNLPPQNGVWADVIINKDTVRVVNLHLRTTTIHSEDTKFLEQHEYILDKERNSKLSSIITRLTENNVVRAEQAEAVAEFLNDSKYRVVLAGDFNDVPLSYTYRKVRGGLKDSFLKGGDGYSYTYNTFYRLLRIDNVFVSPSIKIASYEVDTTAHHSDHYPVIVRLKLSEKQ